MRNIFLMIVCIGIAGGIIAQSEDEGRLKINGTILPFTIDECGDTLILATLDDVYVSTLRKFKDKDEYNRYRRYRYYALKVYPYAVEAIKIFRELEYATKDMKKGKRRKHVRKLGKDLKDEFKDPLKNLTKTQGMILIKMIEKELERPMFDLLKDLRGGFNAGIWNLKAGLYGHKLKDGYIPGEDSILDAVLNDLNISYEVSRR